MNAKEKTQSTPSVREKDTKQKTAFFFKNAALGVGYSLWGYILGGGVLPFGAAPFGVAFLCASDRRVFYIFAGLCISALTSSASVRDKTALIMVYSGVLLIRLAARLIIDPPWAKDKGEQAGEKTISEVYPYAFSEHLALRMCCSAVAAFSIGLYKLIGGGLTYFDMYGTVISTVAAPLSVLLFYGYFKENAKKYHRLFSLLAISAAILWSLGDKKALGISLGVFGCLFLTLFVTRRYGAIVGALSGALVGLAVSVEIAPAFAFAALSAGVLFNLSPTLAAFSALSVALAWGVYTQGLGVLNGSASAIVVSSLCYIVADKLFLAKKDEIAEAAAPLPVCDISAERLRDMESRLQGVSDGLLSTSETLSAVSRFAEPPCATDARQICDDAFDRCCVSCPSKPACWGERYKETSLALNSVCELLRKSGSVKLEATPDALRGRCDRLPDIISEINHNAFVSRRQIIESDRTELFAFSYGAAAEIMKKIAAEGEAEYTPDESAWESIRVSLSNAGFDRLGGAVLGKEKRRLLIQADTRDYLEANKNDILLAVAKAQPFEIGRCELDSALPLLRIYEKQSLSVAYAIRNQRADGEEKYCGDTSGVFEAGEIFYSFISDGMGSGRDAAITSGICGMFLRKLLGGGIAPTEVLELLNGFLRNRGGDSLHECSATVDLLELDTLSGKAFFYKSGAAPTYIFRDSGLFKLRSGTVPVGIIKDLDFKKIDMPLKQGDLVVMVSDGVTDGKEECPWLFDLLRSQGAAAAPDRIAELIVKYAKAEGARDDISVTAIRVNS